MVPYKGLNTQVNVDELLEYGDFAVARRVDRTYNENDIKVLSDGSCIVKQDSSLYEDIFERIPFMSMTMLRQEFPISSAKYNLLMKSHEDDWNGGSVKPWMYRRKAKKQSDCYLMVYKAKTVHRQPAKYQRKFESRQNAEELQDNYEGLRDDIVTNSFAKAKFYKSTGFIFLKHSPTALNFWHYELILEKAEGGTVDDVKYKPNIEPVKMNLKPSFVNFVWKTYLCKHFWVDRNPCEKDIPRDCFYDSKTIFLKRQMAYKVNKCLFSLLPIAI